MGGINGLKKTPEGWFCSTLHGSIDGCLCSTSSHRNTLAYTNRYLHSASDANTYCNSLSHSSKYFHTNGDLHSLLHRHAYQMRGLSWFSNKFAPPKFGFALDHRHGLRNQGERLEQLHHGLKAW